MSRAHTSGPWHVDYAGNGNVWAKDCKVANTANPPQDILYRDVPDAERRANARLIAAAPELLAALESAPIPARGEEMMEFRDRQDKWLRAVRNPIVAKATGEAL